MQIDLWVHQIDTGYPGLVGSDDSPLPVSAFLVKTHDGLYWQATWDSHPLAISGLDALRRLRDAYAPRATVPWSVPHGRWEGAPGDYAIKEGVRAGEVALAAAAPGQRPRVILDIEPHYHAPFPAFWRDDLGAGPREIDDLCWGFAQTAPGAAIDIAPDARMAHLPPVNLAHWCTKVETTRCLPQIYFTDFVSPRIATAADSRAAIDTAIAALAQNGWTRLDTICPIFPGDAQPDTMLRAFEHAHASGLGRPSVWQRSNTPRDLFAAIADFRDPWGPVATPEPVGDATALLRALEASEARMLAGVAFIEQALAEVRAGNQELAAARALVVGT